MSIPVTNTTKLTAAGQIKASAGYLFWILLTNNRESSACNYKFNNATSGTGSEVFQVNVPANDSKYIAFPIAMYFSTGIRIGTMSESDQVAVCGYQ